MRPFHSMSLLMTGALLTSCSNFNSRPEEICLPQGPTRVPMRLVKGLPLVQVSIAGSEPYWFLVDTGATGALISQRLVDQHSLPTENRDVWAIDAHGARLRIPQSA